jgi:hypothetical protein
MKHFWEVDVYNFLVQAEKHLDYVCFLGAWILAGVIALIIIWKWRGRT